MTIVIKSDFFPVQGSGTGVWSANTLCFVWYKKRIFVHYLYYVYVLNFPKGKPTVGPCFASQHAIEQNNTTLAELYARHYTRLTCCTLISLSELWVKLTAYRIVQDCPNAISYPSYCFHYLSEHASQIFITFITCPKNFHHTTFRETVCNDGVHCFI
jgi:hypothetical protein